MKSFKSAEIKKMLPLIFQWFTDNQRKLPWRVDYMPYEVWISEMMLQQTQMERGVEYYLRWMQRFSSVQDVANASESDILQAWEGLGYYSRARNLHAAARIICEKHSGEIPCDADALLALPGIGDYTVAAIMGISFQKDFATIDANVERVFSRLCNMETNKLKVIVTEEVCKILPKGKARIFNQAWMEFGALICKKVPQCEKCPISSFCESYELGVQNLRPIPKKKAEIVPVFAGFALIEHVEHGYLLRQRPQKGLWAGLWEFIGLDNIMIDGEQKSTPLNQMIIRKALLGELELLFNIDIENTKTKSMETSSMETESMNKQKNPKGSLYLNTMTDFPQKAFAQIKHSYTNHRLQALFYRWHINFDLVLGEDYKWVTDLDSVAMPSHHRKAAESCRK